MIQVPLSSKTYPGLVALVDDADAELVAGYSWYPVRERKTFYAQAYVPGTSHRGRKQKQIKMHRLIAGAVPGRQVDHADRNGLNNQRANLRPATPSQQTANQGRRNDNTSGYKGVCWDGQTSKWLVQFQVGGKRMKLGRFVDIVEAARAYDAAAIKHFGKFAVLNFPEEQGAA